MLVGPTAVGKSAVGLDLAESLGGEIVSLDSRQMYVGLDIGTAKPTPAERARAPHHLIDIAYPATPLTLADVQALAYAAIDSILARGKLPITVGGTGQYVRALREGWVVPNVPPDWQLRGELEALAAREGPEALHAQLSAVDPIAAARIPPANLRRVIRSIEVFMRAGEPMSAIQARAGPRYAFRVVGLDRSREALYARVDARIDAMLALGLEDEVRRLAAMDGSFGLPAMSSVGYAEWKHYLTGEIDLAEVVRLIRHNTRRLVRSQGAWFRSDDPAIRWFRLKDEQADDPSTIEAGVRALLAQP